ncbi:MAG TPA: hypothetical protein VKJ00_02635 [Thermoanaerobaculia bacterium]|nr:hypothetical protein [Thermoanaerobaculia bacterium]
MTAMAWNRMRRLVGVYFAFFFVAVAAAPHHHLNALQDLLLDQRSDSGDIVQPSDDEAAPVGAAICSARIVPDVPCAACFMGDFVCNSTASFLLVTGLEPLPHEPHLLELPAPALLPATATSRAPPRVS